MATEIEFVSGGVKCRGDLYLPDGPGPFPVVVMAGGWCYVKELAQPYYARRFNEEGIAALVFDYRSFGSSDGEPRQHIDPWGQIEDYNNAISYVCARPEIDESRVGVWGISYSGGHVLILAANDPRVKAAVSIVPVVDGLATMQRRHGDRFHTLRDLILEDKSRRHLGGDPQYIQMFPFDESPDLAAWPSVATGEVFMEYQRGEAPLYEGRNTIESVEMLLNYTVQPFVPRILNVPILMLVAENDTKTPWDLEIAAFNQIATPRKDLEVLHGVSHVTLYGDPDHRARAAESSAVWFAEQLGAGVTDLAEAAS